MRHEGVGYSLLGSDTAICGISVEGKAESQRSHIGGTEGFIGTQRHGDTENIIKFSEDTESFFRTPWLCPAFSLCPAFPSFPHFPLPCISLCPVFPSASHFPLPCLYAF